jgi:hypothetical protein
LVQFIVAQIDQIFMFCVGIWMTAAGFGYVMANPQPAWRAKLIRHFGWMGPLLLLLAVLLAVAKN